MDDVSCSRDAVPSTVELLVSTGASTCVFVYMCLFVRCLLPLLFVPERDSEQGYPPKAEEIFVLFKVVMESVELLPESTQSFALLDFRNTGHGGIERERPNTEKKMCAIFHLLLTSIGPRPC
jgi:hypothetical protein